MAKKYKIKITKAYHIAIEDEDGYEVASDWSFLDYKETKKQADKLLAETEQKEKWNTVINYAVRKDDGISDMRIAEYIPNAEIDTTTLEPGSLKHMLRPPCEQCPHWNNCGNGCLYE